MRLLPWIARMKRAMTIYFCRLEKTPPGWPAVAGHDKRGRYLLRFRQHAADVQLARSCFTDASFGAFIIRS
jgi:hypothetical protein